MIAYWKALLETKERLKTLRRIHTAEPKQKIALGSPTDIGTGSTFPCESTIRSTTAFYYKISPSRTDSSGTNASANDVVR